MAFEQGLVGIRTSGLAGSLASAHWAPFPPSRHHPQAGPSSGWITQATACCLRPGLWAITGRASSTPGLNWAVPSPLPASLVINLVLCLPEFYLPPGWPGGSSLGWWEF